LPKENDVVLKYSVPVRRTPLFCLVANLLLVYGMYMLCRVLFWAVNPQSLAAIPLAEGGGRLLGGSLLFDTAAVCYTNALYILLMLVPQPWCQRHWWQQMCKWLFVVVNSLALAMNLFDAVYSRYSGRRTTGSFFAEFAGGVHAGGIVGAELVGHWYLVLAGVAMIALLIVLYRRPACSAQTSKVRGRRLLLQCLQLVLFLFLAFAGMRGGISYHRPLSMADASGFVRQPQEVNLVLNTPFSMIRTLGKARFEVPDYFSPQRCEQLYSPLHTPDSSAAPMAGCNIVVLILEGFGSEYWGCLNDTLEDGRYQGYTPFLDSLAAHSVLCTNAFANGRKSIDALPSILSSIPMMIEPYVLTRYATNRVGSLAAVLKGEGYSTAFFHGADNSSMGFNAYSRAVGFDRYYGLDEYCADNHFGGRADFDGYWGIWDAPFLQYFATTLGSLPEPFVTTLFTVTSHHPFHIPSSCESQFPAERVPMHRCVRYTDDALRQFFATASRQPWYRNTLFVITADHTNVTQHPVYETALGLFRVPILLYDPSGTLQPRRIDFPVQQIDIMPTMLGLVGTGQSYLAYGKDWFRCPPQQAWCFNYSGGIYQYICGNRLLQYDGTRVVACYNYRNDPLLQHPQTAGTADSTHLRHLQALVQDYMRRMVDNNLMAK